MIAITPARSKQDCLAIQQVFNHKDIIQYLGGFCILETLLGKLKQSGTTLWKAEVDGQVVGGMEIAGRPQCHYSKWGEVGVLPEYRRRRVGTALYVACAAQSILEGRRLCEDTIVGDNPFQFKALPMLGVTQVGLLTMKTASFKDIALFAFHITVESLTHMLSRLSSECSIELIHDSYTDDLWEKNRIIYEKKRPEFIREIEACRDLIRNEKRIIISEGAVRQETRVRTDTFM